MKNRIDIHRDSNTVMQNKIFNAIQEIRLDIESMDNRKKTVDADVIKVAKSLAREIEKLSDLR